MKNINFEPLVEAIIHQLEKRSIEIIPVSDVFIPGKDSSNTINSFEKLWGEGEDWREPTIEDIERISKAFGEEIEDCKKIEFFVVPHRKRPTGFLIPVQSVTTRTYHKISLCFSYIKYSSDEISGISVLLLYDRDDDCSK